MGTWQAFHLLGIVLWTGGLLAISRMAAYHVAEEPLVQPRFAWVEQRMYWLVAVPGTVITVLTAVGLMVLTHGAPLGGDLPRFRLKLALVLLLIALHILLHLKLKGLWRKPREAKKPVFSALHGCIGLTLIAILLVVKTGG